MIEENKTGEFFYEDEEQKFFVCEFYKLAGRLYFTMIRALRGGDGKFVVFHRGFGASLMYITEKKFDYIKRQALERAREVI